MSLRQKLIVLSKSPAAEIAAEIKYDQSLVQRLFFKSLETRLTRETIMTKIKPLLRNPSVSDEDLIFAAGQASSSDQQCSVKLNKSKIRRPRVNAVEMEYEAKNELNLIPRKEHSTKENNCVEMLDLLRSVQKELSNLKTDVNILKKAKKEVRNHRDEKGKYPCKRCIENDEEVCSNCFKCCGEGHIARKCPSHQINGMGLRN